MKGTLQWSAFFFVFERGKLPDLENIVQIRASNRITFHFPVSEGYNKVDNRIANIVKIIG